MSHNKDKQYNARQLGTQGEHYVERYLQEHGFSTLAQNYRTKQGEIDLIATKAELLIFVEVKTRRKGYFEMSQIISQRKQKRIIMAAHHFLASTSYLTTSLCRFDVALLEGDPFTLTYIPNAFC